MQTFIDTSGTAEGLAKAVNGALASQQAKSLLILSCDGNDFTPESIDPILKDISVPIFGGLFPVVLHEQMQLEKGSVVVPMRAPLEVHFIPGMSDPTADYEDILDEKAGEDDDVKTLLVFVDGLSTRIAAFIDALYAIFGLELNYVGGGAGSLSFKKKPCLITNDGLKEDGGLIAAFDTASGIGVSHGWTTVSGPYKVTESEGNIIKALDWQPAFTVYKEAVEEHSGMRFDEHPLFDIAKAYPFGIARMESERVVRDILTMDENSNLVCVGEVPEGSYVDILHGQSSDLIQAAGLAYEKAQENYSADTPPGLELFMDCVSRVLFLEEQFTDEIKAVTPSSTPMVGACTIGEIANSGNDYLEFYNKTSVVAFLEGE